MTRKAQAAMEFLMTYGWAILVVLAAIAALAYFGVLSPDRFLADKCTANPPFACNEFQLSQAANQVYFVLQNSAGVDVNVTEVNLSCDGVNGALMDIAGGSPPASAVLLNGYDTNVTLAAASLPSGCSQIVLGNRFKATYVITYLKGGETVAHQGTGSMIVRVEA